MSLVDSPPTPSIAWVPEAARLQEMVLLFLKGICSFCAWQVLLPDRKVSYMQDTQQLRLCVLDKQCEVASLAQELQERRCQTAMLKLRLVSCEETIADLQNTSGQLFNRFKEACVANQRTQVASQSCSYQIDSLLASSLHGNDTVASCMTGQGQFWELPIYILNKLHMP